MRRSLFVTVLAAALPAQAQVWSGTWFTTQGVMQLTQTKADAAGQFGTDDPPRKLTGKVAGQQLTFTWTAGEQRGEGAVELDASGHAFAGTWRKGQNNEMRGWRQDQKATQGQPSKLAGYWHSSWGMLQLEQKGSSFSGILGAAGFHKVRGEVQGRRMTLTYQGPLGTGSLWGELRDEGKTLYGAIKSQRGEWSWLGRRLEGHARDAAPQPGVIVDAVSSNRLTYHVRAPEGWKAGDKVPAIVFLHGSNYASKPYLDTIAQANGFGDRFVIIGVDGELWNEDSAPDDPRHNYTYVNWMGKSTYQGFPNTDRESPALVADLIRELRQKLNLTKVYVGGHSQGGFLTWFFAMHFADLVDGVFPIAAGMVIQNEPDVFDKDDVKAAQRRLPIAVVHGEHDEAVAFSQGRDSFERLLEFGFPAAKLFSAKAPHAFIALPWANAITWLQEMSSDDVDALLTTAETAAARDDFRDACAAVLRARDKKPSPEASKRAAALMAKIDAHAKRDAERLRAAIDKNADGRWIDDFVQFRAHFEFADVAKPTMQAFAALRNKHESPANKLAGEARAAFNAGKRDDGWAKYEALVATCYASSWYARVKRWLAERK